MIAEVVSFSLVLTRVAVIVGLTPFFGGSQVPRLLRVGVAVALVSVWWNTFTDATMVGLFDHASTCWVLWLLLVGRELLIGLSLGLAMRLMLAPARIAGEFISQEMMLSFAASTSPGSEEPSTLLAHFLEMAALALFFGIDGHHVLLALMQVAWVYWPVGQGNIWPRTDWLTGISLVMHTGVQLALPVVACLFLLGVALAFWARAAPSLNLFSLGFAARILGGLIAVYLFSPVLVVGLLQALQSTSYWLAGYGR